MAEEIVGNQNPESTEDDQENDFVWDELGQSPDGEVDLEAWSEETEDQNESDEGQHEETDEGSQEDPKPEKKFEDLPEDEAKRREEQSWKDKYYNLEGKYEAVIDRINSVEKNFANPQGQQEEQTQELDIEDAIRQNWGDDPALLNLAKTNKILMQKVQQMEQSTVVNTAKTVYDSIENFCADNADVLSDPEVGAAFIEEMNDRLPNGDLKQLVERAQKGEQFDPKFVEAIKSKLERSLKVAKGNGVTDKVRQNQSKQRVKSRADKPSGGLNGNIPPVTPQKKNKTMSYHEAMAQRKYS